MQSLANPVNVRIVGVAQRQVFERRIEQAGLQGFHFRGVGAFLLRLTRLTSADLGAYCGKNARRINPLMHMQADRIDGKTGALGLAGPA